MTLVKSARRLAAVRETFEAADACYARGDWDQAFHLLERAHVLGQPWAGHHTRAHWMMLKVGWQRRDAREVAGQVLRLAAGGLLTLIGRVPEGNTGGANVPPEQPMPLPPDLLLICSGSETQGETSP